MEAQLEINYHEYKKQADSLNLYPESKTLASWIKSTDLLVDCLKRNKKPYSGAEIAKTRKNLKITLDETERYMYISFYDSDIEFALKFTDTLMYYFNMHHLKVMFDRYEQQCYLLDKQLDAISIVTVEMNDRFEEFCARKSIIDFEKEKVCCFNELVKHDSLKKICLMQIEGLNEVEKLVFEEKRLFKGLPEMLLGYQDPTLYGLFCETEEISRGNDTGNLVAIKRDILVYSTYLRKLLAEKVDKIQQEVSRYESLWRQLTKNEEEYRMLHAKRELVMHQKEKLQLRKTGLIMNRALIVPIISLSVFPHIVQ